MVCFNEEKLIELVLSLKSLFSEERTLEDHAPQTKMESIAINLAKLCACAEPFLVLGGSSRSTIS